MEQIEAAERNFRGRILEQEPASHKTAAIGDGHITVPHCPVAALTLPGGVYNGLFYQTDATGVSAIKETTSGFLRNCVIRSNGRYSARLACAGRFYSISGTFNADGDGTAVVSRSNAGLPNLKVVLHLDSAFGKGHLTGFVSNMDAADPWLAPLTASRAANTFAPTTMSLFLSPPPAEQAAGAPDLGGCQLTVAANGVISLVGQLADGTPISQAVPIAGDGSFPVYISLYHEAGLLAGWINLAGGVPDGSLTWVRPVWISAIGEWESRSQIWLSYSLRFITQPDLPSASLPLRQ